MSRTILNSVAFAHALFVQAAGYAQDGVEQDSGLAGTADQCAQCAAYFQIAGRVLEEPASGTYREYQYAAMMYSYVLAILISRSIY